MASDPTHTGPQPTLDRAADRQVAQVLIVGLGHVGTLTSAAFSRSGIRTAEFDIGSGQVYPTEIAAAAEFVVICVGTPADFGGKGADLQQVRAAVAAVPAGPGIVIRSTVPPGTCRTLCRSFQREIVHWPEYVGETKYLAQEWEALSKKFAIVGATDPRLAASFCDLLSRVFGPETRLFSCSAEESECAKYMENSYLATKVAFVNEWRAIVEASGGEWHQVREAWLLDPRIERSHTHAFPQEPGFSGRCLPKDLDAILTWCGDRSVDVPLLRAVQQTNHQLQGHPSPQIGPRSPTADGSSDPREQQPTAP